MKRVILWIVCFSAVFIGGYRGYNASIEDIDEDRYDLENELESMMSYDNAVTWGEYHYPSGHFDNSESTGYQTKDRLWVQDDDADHFVIYRVVEESGGYVKSTFKPTGMYFTTAAYYYSWWGEWTKNYRNSVDECYYDAYEEIKNGEWSEYEYTFTYSYEDEVQDFPRGFETDFHAVVASDHPYQEYKSETSEEVVSVSDADLYYTETKEYFKIVQKNGDIRSKKLWRTTRGGGGGIIFAVLVFFIGRRIDPTPVLVRQLLDAEWRNEELDQTIYFVKGNNGFVMSILDRGKKREGKIKFKEKGKKFEVQFPDSTQYFKQEMSLDQEELELHNITKNETILYVDNSYS